MSERKEREKTQRRKDIVDAAERVFFSQGFDQTTMIAIADEAELSKGTLYLYFENKNELCMAIILRALKTYRQILEIAIDNKSNGLDQLMTITREFFKFIIEYPDYYKALSNFKTHEAGVNPDSEISGKRKQENRRINDLIKSSIDCGKEDGSISSKVDSSLLSYSIWGDQNGLLPNYLDYSIENQQIQNKQLEAMKYMLKIIIKEVSQETCEENV